MWKMKKDAGTGYSGWGIMMMEIINGLYMGSLFEPPKFFRSIGCPPEFFIGYYPYTRPLKGEYRMPPKFFIAIIPIP